MTRQTRSRHCREERWRPVTSGAPAERAEEELTSAPTAEQGQIIFCTITSNGCVRFRTQMNVLIEPGPATLEVSALSAGCRFPSAGLSTNRPRDTSVFESWRAFEIWGHSSPLRLG